MEMIPIKADGNQTFTVTIPIDGQNKRIKLHLRYNHIAGYWFMDVYDPVTGDPILCGVPMLTGEYPAADLLGQYEYLGLGSCMVKPTNQLVADQIPGAENLGTEFALVWGDRID